jgi:hypothetical protein
MTKYTLECVLCKVVVEYKAKKGMLRAKNTNTPCPSCRGKAPRRHDVGITKWYRECPSCKNIKYYSSKRNYTRAVETNSTCPHCHPGPSQETIQKIIKTLKTKRYPNRASNTKKGKDLPFKRNCPNCSKEMGYASDFSLTRAIKQHAVCNSCSSILYKKSWTYVIKEEHVKKMAAKKAGYDTYDAYMKDLNNRKKYYREVRKITRQQDVSVLENYDKMRGLCGVDGAYQLDHIIPVSTGYEKRIPAEKMGHISNLQIIPWKENLLKSNKQELSF